MKITTSAPRGHQYDARSAVRRLTVVADSEVDYWRLAMVFQGLLRGKLDPQLVKISEALDVPVPGKEST